MTDNGEFDPELCPLLKGFSPERIAERMQHEPILSCRRQLEGLKSSGAKADTIECPAFLAEHGELVT